MHYIYHRPTIEELLALAVVAEAASCLPTGELTVALPLAIPDKLSPHEATAMELSPVASAAHATSLIKVRMEIDFIILLLLKFGRLKCCANHSFPAPLFARV